MATSPTPVNEALRNDTSVKEPAINQVPAPYVAPRLDFVAAWKALRALMKDREDTAQVFKIMQALTGKSLWNQYQRFAKTEVGARIIRDEISLLDTLMDREALSKLPEGSLGRVYLDFMIREGLTADGLVDASDDTLTRFDDRGLQIYAGRTRELHDLWHVVTGFGRDGLGEYCVVGFSYSQTKSKGFAAISLMGAIDLARKFPRQGVFKAVRQAFRIGRKAEWLPAQDWEALLKEPFEEVRAKLKLAEPTYYKAAAHISAQTMPEPMPAAQPDLVAAA